MLLHNVNILGGKDVTDIWVEQGKIRTIHKGNVPIKTNNTTCLQFNNAMVFPGLINSHDHLDFNLFSQTGNRIYNNYAEWGKDIHKQNREEINRVLQIPHALRVQWGLYKNLLNGFTTVVNHGERLNANTGLISVIENCISLHSVQFERHWKYKLNGIFTRNTPFVIHLGEGTDKSSADEIDRLIKWNLLNKKIIAVHGVSMTEKQSASFDALVWCPVSNYFLLNKTAAVDKLKKKTRIIFGSDSTLTGDWNLWKHIRIARKTGMMNDDELFNSLTKTPALVWNLNDYGDISENQVADIVVAKRKHNLGGMDLFYALNPEDILLVLHKGVVQLFDSELYEQLAIQKYVVDNFSHVLVNGCCKYVRGDLPGLMDHIGIHYPGIRFPFSE